MKKEKQIDFNYYFEKIDSSNIKHWDKIIFCDIDWTIFRDSLYIEIFLWIIEILSKYQEVSNILTKYHYSLNKWKNRQWWYDDFLWKTIILFKKSIKWLPVKFFNEICEKIIQEKSKRTYVYSLNMLKLYQEKWFKVILISWSPDNIVSWFAKKHNFDLWLWSYYFTQAKNLSLNLWIKDRHTKSTQVLTWDNILIATSQSKETIVNYIKKKYNPSYTISLWDTNGDYNMLNMTDIWYAINPSFELYERIKNNNKIQVIIERKDLILELNSEQRQSIIYYDNKNF